MNTSSNESKTCLYKCVNLSVRDRKRGFARRYGLAISNYRQKGRAQHEEGKGEGKGEEVGRSEG
jgi:hypothetical protein